MTSVLAHSLHWLEPLLLAPAFAIVLAAIARDRRARRGRRAGGAGA